MRLRGTICLLVVAGAAIALWLTLGQRPTIDTSTARASSTSTMKITPSGTASCSGLACHGGLKPQNAQGSEHSTWTTHDPHARAFAVLFDERSRLMEKNLKNLARLEDAHPETNALCLRCHGRAEAQLHASPSDRQWLDDGFGCESCHGEASKWLGPHTASERWAKLTDQQKWEDHGMRPMRTVAQRAAVCVECHVGNASQEVNHDLIAAGHPDLAFEYSSYLANLPRHWRKAKDKDHEDEFQAWALGQLVSSKAALELLASRASDEKKPWPEFAEYDCRSCHRDVGEADSGAKGRMPGAWRFDMWHHAGPQLLLASHGAWEHLEREMEKPMPERRKVEVDGKKLAAILDKQLDNRLNLVKMDRAALKGMIEVVVRSPRLGVTKGDTREVVDWNRASTLTFALAGFYQALESAGEGNPELKEEIQDLVRQFTITRTGRGIRGKPKKPNQIDFFARLEKIRKLLEQ